MLHIVISVEADEIGPHDTLQQRLLPFRRQQTEYLVGRKRDMQEKTDGSVRLFLPEQVRQQHKLVVMYPDLIIRLQQGRQRFCKLLIDLHIDVEEPALILAQGRNIVKKGPDHEVGKPIEII